jgi:hypothetical protein
LHTGAGGWWGSFPLVGFMTLYCSHGCIMLWFSLHELQQDHPQNLIHNTWVILGFGPASSYFQQLQDPWSVAVPFQQQWKIYWFLTLQSRTSVVMEPLHMKLSSSFQ